MVAGGGGEAVGASGEGANEPMNDCHQDDQLQKFIETASYSSPLHQLSQVQICFTLALILYSAGSFRWNRDSLSKKHQLTNVRVSKYDDGFHGDPGSQIEITARMRQICCVWEERSKIKLRVATHDHSDHSRFENSVFSLEYSVHYSASDSWKEDRVL